MNLEKRTECFEKINCALKSKGNSHKTRPKRGKFALKCMCKMVS